MLKAIAIRVPFFGHLRSVASALAGTEGRARAKKRGHIGKSRYKHPQNATKATASTGLVFIDISFWFSQTSLEIIVFKPRVRYNVPMKMKIYVAKEKSLKVAL
jgi:hypothetical protein